MKLLVKKFALFSCLAASILISSCSNTDDSGDVAVDYSAENSTRAAQADNVIENTLNIMENGYVEAEEGRSIANSFFPACTVITIIPNGEGGTIILDFGTGCTLNNGSVVTGKINLEYGGIVSGTRTITYTFEEFTYNGHGVTGGGEIVREIENANGFPASTVNETITVHFSNTEITATRVGLRMAEWIEGVGSGTWEDNVYRITGNWETTFSNGFSRSGEVTEPLIRKLSCVYLVSGTLDITQQSITGTLDFGDGTCDNVATFIFNGQEYTIILGL
ncbi:hypothetical protein ATE92_0462 [Ulvibacter sp. MAR_2010_11]|uniref:hypothetical protein n=1 Tax=Ulvibacter sp. MAR_2010_11 TaxID=1250229 RepID=UPI000C2C06A3|nr:hypothetical protein [Ulvibacter sp. MAR_2010_11]PKA82334.1 hypothetical protein ATE92_0462 [Ulvibacter sp. MAR_2010_11]